MPLHIIVVNSLGDLDWASRCEYTNNPLFHSTKDLSVDAAGRPIASALTQTSTGSFCNMMTFASNGQSVTGELIPVPPAAAIDLLIHPDGQRTVMGEPYYNFPITAPQWLLQMDSTGTTAERRDKRYDVVGNENVSTIWSDAALAGDRLLLAGVEFREDIIFGTLSERRAYAGLPLDSLESCFWNDTILPRYAIPAGILALTAITDHVSLPMDSTLAQVTGPLATLTPLTIPTQVSLCNTITSIGDTHADGLLTIRPTLLQRGEELLVSDAPEGILCVRDASGRLITSMRTGGSTTISLPSATWAPGLHLLQLIDSDGSVRAARVMVQ